MNIIMRITVSEIAVAVVKASAEALAEALAEKIIHLLLIKKKNLNQPVVEEELDKQLGNQRLEKLDVKD